MKAIEYSLGVKTIKLICVLLFAAGMASGAEETLDDLLDRRIEINKKYRDQYTEEAADAEFAEKLQPLEKKIGQGWVDYLTYVKSLKDQKLKEQVLRLELLHELSGSYYDLEYAEGLLEKAKLRGQIKKWERELALLDAITGKGKKTSPKDEAEESKKTEK